VVKGLEKLTSVRLAEVITQKNSVPAEAITDALYSQDKHGEPFAQTLVAAGHITEWDLAKLVAENFQLPFLMASNYQVSDEAKKRIPDKVLFENLIVPLDLFDDVLCIVMPILTPFETIMKLQKDSKVEVFPYVGLITENKKVLGSLFPEFKAWVDGEQKRREQRATQRANGKEKDGGSWMSIFDAGDQAIQDTLGSARKPTPKR
jgi:hypothetical protein